MGEQEYSFFVSEPTETVMHKNKLWKYAGSVVSIGVGSAVMLQYGPPTSWFGWGLGMIILLVGDFWNYEVRRSVDSVHVVRDNNTKVLVLPTPYVLQDLQVVGMSNVHWCSDCRKAYQVLFRRDVDARLHFVGTFCTHCGYECKRGMRSIRSDNQDADWRVSRSSRQAPKADLVTHKVEIYGRCPDGGRNFFEVIKEIEREAEAQVSDPAMLKQEIVDLETKLQEKNERLFHIETKQMLHATVDEAMVDTPTSKEATKIHM
jgi:hypothetical protein